MPYKKVIYQDAILYEKNYKKILNYCKTCRGFFYARTTKARPRKKQKRDKGGGYEK